MDFWNGLARMEWAGQGQVICPHGQARACDFWVAQLINSNVVVQIFNVDQPLTAEAWLWQHPSLELMGTLASGAQIRVRAFHLVSQRGADRTTRWERGWGYEGFLTPDGSVEVWNTHASMPPPHHLTALLTNVVLAGRHDPIQPTLAGVTLELEDAAQFPTNQRFARALKTTSVCSVLIMPLSVHTPEQAEALIAEMCELLSFAQRSLVSCVARIWRNEAGQVVQQRLQLPYFYYPAALRPLIPPDALAGFLEATYDNYQRLWQPWNLGQAIDHYVQAMALRSAWSQSLGFFTALETLKWAFLKQPGHKHRGRSLRSTAKLSKVTAAVKATIEGLDYLSEEEKAVVKEKVAELEHRPYKAVLADLFESLSLSVDSVEVDELVAFRNRVIHRGHPDDADTRTAFSRATRFAGLVERVMCAILGYQGEMELYPQGIQLTGNET